MATFELDNDIVRDIAGERVGDTFRYAKIGSALGIVLAPNQGTDLSAVEFLMARHTDKSHEGVKEGMMAPICETVMAVAIGDDDWRPETTDEVAFRSLSEELGIQPGDVNLMTSGTNERYNGSWTMSWPMNQPNMPRDVLDTFGVCRMLVTDSRDIETISAFDLEEISGAEWLSVGAIGNILANGEVEKLRPGVHEWFTQALIRLPSFLEAWQRSPVIVPIPAETEPMCDLRFNVPPYVSMLGLSEIRNQVA